MIPEWQFRGPNVELMAPAPVRLMGGDVELMGPNVELMAPAPVEIMGLGEDGESRWSRWYPLGWHLILAVPSAVISGVHGYKRNRGDRGWAVVWGAFGYVFPILTPIVALIQGFGDPK